jgi:hypothetical protein
LQYVAEGGPKITEAIYRHVIDYLKELPKPITDPEALVKLLKIRNEYRNVAISKLSE